MSARRLGRLLGSALALVALLGAVFVTNEVLAFNQMTFDWVAGVSTVMIDGVSGYTG
ncbi:hypothetical protein ACI2K4_12955 [Micromonospora sp. NPDC050397]|uniref:hypothetical protein n=1 Tax=Micromonospora sp. NPDC050397 TaxID=3364279 RepID=UPI00384D810A